MIQQKKMRYISPKVRKKYKKKEKKKRNSSKNSRALGLEHTSIRGKHVMPRSIGPDCKRRSKCFTKVNSLERNMILENFSNIGHKEKQDTYIVRLIKLQAISRNRRRKNSKPKKISCFYKFRIGNVEKCMCKKAFCSILGIEGLQCKTYFFHF